MSSRYYAYIYDLSMCKYYDEGCLDQIEVRVSNMKYENRALRNVISYGCQLPVLGRRLRDASLVIHSWTPLRNLRRRKWTEYASASNHFCLHSNYHRCPFLSSHHVQRLLDHFKHTSPNGTHICLVLEILGPSVKSRTDRLKDGRLPGRVARNLARQALLGLDHMH